MRALLFGVSIGAPDFWKLPYESCISSWKGASHGYYQASYVHPEYGTAILHIECASDKLKVPAHASDPAGTAQGARSEGHRQPVILKYIAKKMYLPAPRAEGA